MRLLKIHSLPSTKQSGWVDRDEIMLHACFQILIDCVEKEDILNDGDYEAHKETIDEIKFLYDWWNKRKDKIIMNDEQDKEDDEMLIRLMKIRTFLWT